MSNEFVEAWERDGRETRPAYYQAKFSMVTMADRVTMPDTLMLRSDDPLPFIAGHEYVLTLQVEGPA